MENFKLEQPDMSPARIDLIKEENTINIDINSIDTDIDNVFSIKPGRLVR